MGAEDDEGDVASLRKRIFDLEDQVQTLAVAVQGLALGTPVQSILDTFDEKSPDHERAARKLMQLAVLYPERFAKMEAESNHCFGPDCCDLRDAEAGRCTCECKSCLRTRFFSQLRGCENGS